MQQEVESPSRYIESLPSKGVRSRVISALNIWYEVPYNEMVIIKQVVRFLHEASLMLDDIEDSSTLRRGKPCAHTIFGIPQTMNSPCVIGCSAKIASHKACGSCPSVPVSSTTYTVSQHSLSRDHVFVPILSAARLRKRRSSVQEDPQHRSIPN